MNSDPRFQPRQLLAQGMQLHRASRLQEAEKCYARVLELDPENVEALNLMGILCSHAREVDRGLEFLSRAAGIAPDNPEVHTHLSHLYRLAGRIDESIAAGEHAVSLDDNNATAQHNLAFALEEQERFGEAKAHYEKAIVLNPHVPQSLYQLASIYMLHELEFARAAELFHKCLELQPANFLANLQLGHLYLTTGDHARAVQNCRRVLELDPGNRRAISCLAFAALESGDDDLAHSLMDYATLISTVEIACPEGFDSMDDFNAALCEHVCTHPTLKYESHATKFGEHTGVLTEGEPGPIALLQTEINHQIRVYLDSLPVDPAHPFLANVIDRWQLAVWGVVMGDKGHQVVHDHPSAIVSGVYYARLPGVLGEKESDPAGWLEFGRPPDRLKCAAEPLVELVRPRPGVMVLFPSYLYHRTVPFRSDEKRISIAFDALPEGKA